MSKFNFEDALNGYPICTRCGNEVRVLCFDANSDTPIVALVVNNKTRKEETLCYFKNGRISKTEDTPYDLVMKELTTPEGLLPENLAELELWQLIPELRKIFQIKAELSEQDLTEFQCDPDTGYCMHDICHYEKELLKEIRGRYAKIDSEEINTDIFEYFLKDAQKEEYSEYTREKFAIGKFAKVEYGSPRKTDYAILSDRFISFSPINNLGYFFNLNTKSVNNGCFDLKNGERDESCKVIAIENNISAEDAMKRYSYFLYGLSDW